MTRRLLAAWTLLIAVLAFADSGFAQTTVIRDSFVDYYSNVNVHVPEISSGYAWYSRGFGTPWLSNGALGIQNNTGSWAMALIESGISDGSVAVDWSPNSASTPFATVHQALRLRQQRQSHADDIRVWQACAVSVRH